MVTSRVPASVVQPYATVPAYRTKDGSEIRELMHPDVHGNRAQSLAEATVPAGTRTLRHRHRSSEELYHVVSGEGRMTLGPETFPVRPGDTILIPPGETHCIEATGHEALRLLCCCAPAYSDDDTELLACEEPAGCECSKLQSPSAGEATG
jgi:mannose-6-phosphate isomerase-like protein (cupin superfamily)